MKINFVILLMCISILLSAAVFALFIHDMRKHKKQKAKIKKLSRKEFESRKIVKQKVSNNLI